LIQTTVTSRAIKFWLSFALDYSIWDMRLRAGRIVIRLPVLFGQDGKVAKSFNVDAFRPHDSIAVEIEAGGAFENNRILYDLIKMTLGVIVEFGVLIVPQKYQTENRRFRDPYEESRKLFDAIWANPERLKLPLEGLLLVGY
jgi:hypothetical protein